MKILSRYVLREYLQPFLYCFVTFYGLYVLSTLFGTLGKMTQAHTPLGPQTARGMGAGPRTARGLTAPFPCTNVFRPAAPIPCTPTFFLRAW